MSWFYLAPLNALCAVLCYLTNWLAVAFADETGELPGFLKYWQTWDDSLDVEWYVKESVPKLLRYDFDKHYTSGRIATPELAEVGRDRGFVMLKEPYFTVKERIQRYFCRTLWLYRNNGYGFAFWIFGRNVVGENVVRTVKREGTFFDVRTKDGQGAWGWHIEWPITKHLATKIYIGWKIGDNPYEGKRRAMLADRLIAFKII